MNSPLVKYEEAKNKLTLKQKVGQLFMPAVFINDSEEEVQKMEYLIQKMDIGAICFFHSRASAATNFEGEKKIVHNENSYQRLVELISRYQKASAYPLLVAIDAEWGLAMRIENSPQYPYSLTLGAIQNQDELIFQVGEQIGLDCRKAGIHWNLAPVVDINNNPNNPVIGYRSFGDDKHKVLAKAKSLLEGMSSVGTLNALKHFPGHGDTATDSHLGLPIINKSKEELLENELYPFKELIQQGADSVMVGHLAVPSLDTSENPATTSYPIITDLLRTALGFKGVIISDALNMHAVSKKYEQKGSLEAAAFAAGMDVMCFSEYPVEGIEEILNTASAERIDASFKRVWRLKEKAFLNEALEKSERKLDANQLNKKLAKWSLTEHYGDINALQKIKEDGFLNLSIPNPTENLFSAEIERRYKQEHVSIDLANMDSIRKTLTSYDNVVLALFPPAVKPKDQFGFEPRILDFIKEVITQKNTLIYLFGNPYVADILNLKEKSNLVLVYQDFLEFQEVGIEHFNDQTKANGQLPVQLNFNFNKGKSAEGA